MKFIINDGILEKCILNGNEREINIPWNVKEISKDAFVGNDLSGIKSLTLPESLEKIHYEAFRGIGPLKSITVRTYGEDEFRLYSEKNGVRKWEPSLSEPLSAEELVIMKGECGKKFVIWELFDQMPQKISVFSDTDLNLIYKDDCTIDSERDAFRSLTIYGEGYSLDQDLKVYSYICCAEKVQYINTRIRFHEERYDGAPEVMAFGPMPAAMMLHRIENRVDWSKETPYSWSAIETLKPQIMADKLQKLFLPEGLQKIEDNIIHCNNLRKLVIPADVKSISHSIRYCASLSNVHVEIHADSDLEVDTTSFFECPKLKVITLYEQDIRTGYKKIVKKVPKQEWLKYHYKKSILNEFTEDAPEAADNVFGRVALALEDEYKDFYEGASRMDYDFCVKEQNCVISEMRHIVQSSTEESDAKIQQTKKYLDRIELVDRIESLG